MNIGGLPIPPYVLIHSVQYATKDKASAYDNVYSDYVKLSSVRVDLIDKIIKTSNGDEVRAKATLFYDTYNSVPRDHTFVVGDKVEFMGEVYYVQEIAPLYTTRLHHYEITLI